MNIRSFQRSDIDAVVDLSLRAWEPVFASIRATLDSEVYDHFHPDWRETQGTSVRDVCNDDAISVWVAVEHETVIGFTALKTDTDSQLGEIYMLAVDPDHQRKGVGAALTRFGISWLRDAGMEVAMVETGGDPGHAPARETYERAGFKLFPSAQYFLKL
jgi:GNAT superfamily N-acetyltransferase